MFNSDAAQGYPKSTPNGSHNVITKCEDQNNDQKGLFLDRCIIKTDSLDPNGVIAELSYHVYGEMK